MNGTPLPGALSGNKVERLIEIDEALLYLVTGALVWLLDREPLEQTGTLTVEDARDEISTMFYIYLEEENVIPVGGTMNWHTNTPPDGWLICNGQAVSRADYSRLFALWGTTFGAGNGTTTFNLLNMQDRSPMGADATGLDVNETAGAFTHTINANELPAHSHPASAGGFLAVNPGAPNLPVRGATNIKWEEQANTGLNSTPNNPMSVLHPIMAVHVIVRAK